MQNEKTISILNDLVAINNDRIEGYQKAVKELDSDSHNLKTLFSNNADQSRNYIETLKQAVKDNGGDPETGTTTSGKIYRMWMDLRSTFTTAKKHSVLSLCEFGEDAALKAYDKALEDEAEMEPKVYRLILDQKASVQSAHDHIKTLRDQMEKVS